MPLIVAGDGPARQTGCRAAAGGNQSEAARRLGVSRVGLIKKLTRLGLR
jgi:DNA-binding protein Fis